MNRRSFLLGVGALIAAPAVVRAEWIMPVKRLILPTIIQVSPDRFIKDGKPYWVEDGVWSEVRDVPDILGPWRILPGIGSATPFSVPPHPLVRL